MSVECKNAAKSGQGEESPRCLGILGDMIHPAVESAVRTRVEFSPKALEAFCRKREIVELSLFGSVFGTEFDESSDIDVLVTFDEHAHPTLFDLADMEEELEGIFGREVDLLTRRGIEMSRNPYRRKAILGSAQVIYAQ